MEHARFVRSRPPRMLARPRWLITAIVAALLLLGGCRGVETAETCVSWAPYPDEASRREVAHAVVDGLVTERAGDRAMFGTQAAVWSIEVTGVVQGDVEVGERLEVASTPPTCTQGTYPDGDPLDTDDAVRLFLVDSDFDVPDTAAGWALLTPSDGVRPLPAS